MEIILNGQPKVFSSPVNLRKLVEDLGLNGGHFAVALNDTVISRKLLEETNISDGDCIEIIRAVGGG